MVDSTTQRPRIATLYLTFATMFVIGIALSVIEPGLFSVGSRTLLDVTRVQATDGDLNNDAVQIITTTDEWKAAIASGRCVLFVDCDWNVAVVAFRRSFADFASWSRDNANHKAITFKVDADSKDEMWHAIQDLWKDNSISPGSMKTYGGAGRVVWFKESRVVDFAWCMEVFEMDTLKSRTKDAFQ